MDPLKTDNGPIGGDLVQATSDTFFGARNLSRETDEFFGIGLIAAATGELRGRVNQIPNVFWDGSLRGRFIAIQTTEVYPTDAS